MTIPSKLTHTLNASYLVILVESAISFQSGKETLSAILNLPTIPNRHRVGVFLVLSGARGRLGSVFQFPYFARQFAAQGIPTFRMDPSGVGDSTGNIPDMPMLDYYGAVSNGRMVPDAVAAIQEFRNRASFDHLILLGVCAGAITSVLASQVTSHPIAGMALLGLPVLIDSSKQTAADSIPPDFAESYLKQGIVKNVFSIQAWRKLLAGQSDTRFLWKHAQAAARGVGKKIIEKTIQRTSKQSTHPRLNRKFIQSMDHAMKMKTPCLFIYGSNDPYRWDFQREFHDNYCKGHRRYEKYCQVHTIVGGNHLFTLREWQNQALDLVFPWLSKISGC